MRDVLGPGTTLGYCTNVHAGNTLEEIQHNLERYAADVRQLVCPEEHLGIGLWLPASAAAELLEGSDARDRIQAFRDWLHQHRLAVFTINGFPYGDFHRDAVKYDVYHPNWSLIERARYTRDLGVILQCLLASHGEEGSISTLPLSWRSEMDDTATRRAVDNLRFLAHNLARLEEESGALIHVDVEPEPGCYLDRAEDVVRLFDDHLDDERLRRYLRVCHDVCHAAVMGEDQASVLERYRMSGIKVGKIQISSAVRVRFDELDEPARREALEQLRAFGEDRYLHQTTITADNGSHAFFDDLPQAIAAAQAKGPAGEWRVHYHVPIYLERFGLLETTQNDIHRCLAAIGDDVKHFEVETYAWNVLPEELKTSSLAHGIAKELQWLIAREGTKGQRDKGTK